MSASLDVQSIWPLDRIKDHVDKIGSGVTPTGGAASYLDAGIPLLRSQNVHFDGLRLDDVAYISEETHDEMRGSKVRPRDVLLNITGASIGRCTFVPDDFGEANVNQHVCIIRSLHPLNNIASWRIWMRVVRRLMRRWPSNAVNSIREDLHVPKLRR